MKPRGVKRLFGFPSRSRDEVRGEIAEEFRFHLDMRIEELTQAGVDPEAARVQALQEFGDPDSGANRCAVHGERLERHRRAARLASELRQDTTVALRQLAAGPGFAIVAILTLALGIGATAAIFSALDAVLLRPLPYRGADRLVEVFETNDTGRRNSVSGGAFLDWRDHQTQFDSLTLVTPISANLRGTAAPERLTGLEVSHGFLRVFGIMPILGSGFLPEHDQPGAFNAVVILTEELWRSRFGGDPSIVGTSIVLDEVPRTVVGILPSGAWIFREAQFLVPAVLMPGTSRSRRSPHWAEVYGRLKPATTAMRADAELKAVKQQLAPLYPAFKQKWNVMVQPLHDVLSADRRAVLLTLLGAVALVLLIACANVANLLLARACRRQQEMALRRALGATSARLMRQVLTEAAILAGLGGVAGVALASWGVKFVGLLMTDVVPQAMTPHLDARVLAFAVVLCGFTGRVDGRAAHSAPGL
jgi:predicted permease